MEGCLGELLVMHEECCFPVARSTSFELAALAEPLSIGIYSVKQSIPMQGAKVAILGVGPIGLSTLLPAIRQGAESVYITDKLDYRVEVAKQAGAAWGGNPDSQDIVAAIKEMTPEGVDCVFECCGQQEALDQAMNILRPGGKLMITGIPRVERLSFRAEDMRRREITIYNVRRQVHCVQDAIDMVENPDMDMEFMITHRFGLEETKKAFDLVENYDDGVIKAMINFE
jgi:L-iditol 2-dehydrogenase